MSGNAAEGIFRFLAGLLPKHDATKEEHYNYMMRLGLTVSALVLCFGAAVVFAYGFVPGVTSGFARAESLTAVIGEIRANRTEELDAQLLNLRIKQCNASTDQAKQLFYDKIQRALDEYAYLNPKRSYPIPPCSEL